MSKSDTIELTMTIHRATLRAVLASDNGEEENAVWLPLSQISIRELGGCFSEITLPEWLAEEKGLL